MGSGGGFCNGGRRGIRTREDSSVAAALDLVFLLFAAALLFPFFPLLVAGALVAGEEGSFIVPKPRSFSPSRGRPK